MKKSLSFLIFLVSFILLSCDLEGNINDFNITGQYHFIVSPSSSPVEISFNWEFMPNRSFSVTSLQNSSTRTGIYTMNGNIITLSLTPNTPAAEQIGSVIENFVITVNPNNTITLSLQNNMSISQILNSFSYSSSTVTLLYGFGTDAFPSITFNDLFPYYIVNNTSNLITYLFITDDPNQNYFLEFRHFNKINNIPQEDISKRTYFRFIISGNNIILTNSATSFEEIFSVSLSDNFLTLTKTNNFSSPFFNLLNVFTNHVILYGLSNLN